jgi:hypothetical protein
MSSLLGVLLALALLALAVLLAQVCWEMPPQRHRQEFL